MEKHSLVLTPDGICSIIEEPELVMTLSGPSAVKGVMLVDRPSYEVEFVDGSHIVLSEDTLIYCKKWSPLKPQNWRVTKLREILNKKDMVMRKNLDYGLRIKSIKPVGLKECVECTTWDGTLILKNQIVIGVGCDLI